MSDAHTHIGGESEAFEINEQLLLQSMEKYGIDVSIVLNADCAEYDGDSVRLPEENQIDQEEALKTGHSVLPCQSGKDIRSLLVQTKP